MSVKFQFGIEHEDIEGQMAMFDFEVLRLQQIVDAAGGVPADIPLWARIDCLAKQRDGLCPITSGGFGRYHEEGTDDHTSSSRRRD